MKRIISLFLVFCFAFAPASYGRGPYQNLYRKFRDKKEIKVYLKSVKSDLKDVPKSVRAFQKSFKEILPKRVNVKFRQMSSERGADVVITAKITKYEFSAETLPNVISVLGAIVDTTAPKSSAKLTVDYTIFDPSGKEKLSAFKNFTTNERRPKEDMEGEKAFLHAATKNINRFLYRAFQKPKKRGQL